ncbi:hypothetical protein [Salinicola tamaricis]|uniref:hypothetical protein n=1 Tax=Salinicola tamaricis TaxID=1771309 RepID=UPI0030F4ABA0
MTVLLALATLLCPAELLPRLGDGLDSIRQRDFLQVATRNGPITFYQGGHGPTGFEYELVRRFAHSLGVSLAVKNDNRINDVLDDVRRGRPTSARPRSPWIRAAAGCATASRS